ncbi:hypothetical protein AN640_04690 [Candidatus Epulonipiscium fishelsonii]|uniref:Uncharacterized protein n=1 Tax=Candidatus Epulonipiscium fishelsonii TaxID=77094 RepID=A0ACC8XIG6_9FIRM|nr:hypothetical protein AN640_04690 [Epulopiscium sp. SCG-D08WGA-EpuloA1]OON95142.1 MAG: hypothetical protein ATN32_07335 [Epulopiscium sp. AS2M-Bin002]
MQNIFNHFDQVGIAVKDIEKTITLMNNIFTWKFSEIILFEPTAIYKEEEIAIKAKLAYCFVNGFKIELIEPISNKSIWQDYLAYKGDGFQHFMIDVDNFEEVKKILEANGGKIVQSGKALKFKGAYWTHFDFIDTLGLCLEIINCLEVGKRYLTEVSPKGNGLFENLIKVGISTEFCEPTTDKNTWQKYFNNTDKKIHYLLFEVDQFELAKEKLEKNNIPIVQDGLSKEYKKWGYFDATKLLGYYIALLSR